MEYSKMSWFSKISQEIPGPPDEASNDEIYENFGDPTEWHPGQLTILNDFGLRMFMAARVIAWEEVAAKSNRHENVDENTIVAPNPFGSMTYKKGEIIPIEILGQYSDMSTRESYDPGTIHMVGAQNLYHTLEELLRKQLRTIYADFAISLAEQPHIKEFIRDFPKLVGDIHPSSHIEYHPFEIQGYEVLVIRDPRAYVSYGRDDAEFPYYWQIPELSVRSYDFFSGKDINPKLMKVIWSRSGGPRYESIQTAANAAEAFLDYMFNMQIEE